MDFDKRMSPGAKLLSCISLIRFGKDLSWACFWPTNADSLKMVFLRGLWWYLSGFDVLCSLWFKAPHGL